MITLANTKQEIFDAYELLLAENEALKTDKAAVEKVLTLTKKMPFVNKILQDLYKKL